MGKTMGKHLFRKKKKSLWNVKRKSVFFFFFCLTVLFRLGTSVAVLYADSIRDPEEHKNVRAHLSKHPPHRLHLSRADRPLFRFAKKKKKNRAQNSFGCFRLGNVLEVHGAAGAKKMLVMSTPAYSAFTAQRADTR